MDCHQANQPITSQREAGACTRAEPRIDVQELELAQATFNERGAYEAIAQMSRQLAGQRSPLAVLDTCSASGLASYHACEALQLSSLTLVDIDPVPLRIAVERKRHAHSLVAECADAVTYESRQRYDLILMNSAYHHIEDNRKASFLERHRGLLARRGRIVVGDHFLPPYGSDPGSFDAALRAFYLPLFAELRRRGTRDEAVRVVEKSFQLALRRTIEFKVSFALFEEHVSRAGLVVERIERIWGGPTEARWGTFVVQLAPASSSS